MQVWQILLVIAGAVVFLLTLMYFVFDGDGSPQPGEHESPPGTEGPARPRS